MEIYQNKTQCNNNDTQSLLSIQRLRKFDSEKKKIKLTLKKKSKIYRWAIE